MIQLVPADMRLCIGPNSDSEFDFENSSDDDDDDDDAFYLFFTETKKQPTVCTHFSEFDLENGSLLPTLRDLATLVPSKSLLLLLLKYALLLLLMRVFGPNLSLSPPPPPHTHTSGCPEKWSWTAHIPINFPLKATQ